MKQEQLQELELRRHTSLGKDKVQKQKSGTVTGEVTKADA
jgi:hypothetical protein